VNNKNYYAIILCGGSGTRLWPFSRSNKPKQFLKFDSSLTLFQKTFNRVSQLVAKDKIYIVTNVEYYYEVKGQLIDINDDAIENIICEPIAKNTLPAITYAVNEIEKKCKTAVIGTFSSDHEIESPNEFKEIYDRAVFFAKKNYLVIFGIKPTEPNCGYGYIKPGEKVSSEFDNLFTVDKFIEKPNLADAENFIRDGYFWNTGMFVFTASCFLRLIKKYQPSVYNLFQNDNSIEMKDLYDQLPSISIDCGLVEKIDNCIVISTNLVWTDLGTWNSVHNFFTKRNNECNSRSKFIGNIISEDVSNSLIWSNNEKLIATYGLEDLIIVNDHDAILICKKNKADNIKIFIDKIRKKKPEFLSDHPVVNRPWGQYKVIENNNNFKIKLITVNPKQSLSLQLHNHRSEHWVVVEGVATIKKDDNISELKVNESTFIKAKQKHSLANQTDKTLKIIEVATGSIIDESDIVRFTDMYGRK